MATFRNCALLVLIAGLLAAASLLVNAGARDALWDTPREDEISVADAVSLGADVLWIDARSADAHARGHLSGALLLNEDRWEELFIPVVERWSPGMNVIVYCDSTGCQASRKVAERLRLEAGIESIKVLRGDWTQVRSGR